MLNTDPSNQIRALTGTVSIHEPGLIKASDYGVNSFVGIQFDAATTIDVITPAPRYKIEGTAGHAYLAGQYLPWQFAEINITGAATLILGT